MYLSIICGFIVGLLCMCGLGFGLAFVVRAQVNQRLSDAQKTSLNLRGGALILGQLVLAVVGAGAAIHLGASPLALGGSLFLGGAVGFVLVVRYGKLLASGE